MCVRVCEFKSAVIFPNEQNKTWREPLVATAVSTTTATPPAVATAAAASVVGTPAPVGGIAAPLHCTIVRVLLSVAIPKLPPKTYKRDSLSHVPLLDTPPAL